MRVGTTLLVALLALVGAGCGTSSSARTIDGWQGAEAHLEVVGTLDGEALDISLGDAASDTAEVFCTREYSVPEIGGVAQYDMGELIEIKIDAWVTIGGVRRLIELELKQHDFQSDTVPATVRVVPRSDTMDPASDQMWLEWEWHDEADATLYEAAAQTGTFELELYTGTPDATGLVIPNGMGEVGGYFDARWSETEELHGSFTVACTESIVSLVPM